jgi:hypothetical protein
MTMTTILGFLAGPLAIWFLGQLRETKPYKAAMGWLGRAVFNAFATLSGVGTSRLGKHLWMPIEGIIADILFIVGEQAPAGLRSDNLEKLETHVERLESVGSVTRASALKDKLELLRATELPEGTDPAIAQRLQDLGAASTEEKLGQ